MLVVHLSRPSPNSSSCTYSVPSSKHTSCCKKEKKEEKARREEGRSNEPGWGIARGKESAFCCGSVSP